MNEPTPDRRPSLLDLWMSHHFDVSRLASAAEVSEETVQAMMNYKLVKKEDAQKVLAQLSILLHKDCTFDTVYVPCIESADPEVSKSEVARLLQQIDAEYTSSWQALHGLALGTAKHDFINQRLENIARHIDELRPTIGDKVAMEAWIAWQDQAASSFQTDTSL